MAEQERLLRNRRFCCFCGVSLISAAFGGRQSRKSKGPWKWLPEKERTLRNGRFCCFCGVLLISAAFGGRKSRKSAKWTVLLLLWGSPHFGNPRQRNSQKSTGLWKWLPEKERTLRNGRFCCFSGVPLISATLGGGNPENPKGHGNGFRKRSAHCEMDDFAAFVGFPSFRQPSTAEAQKIQGALEMASGKGANIAKWTILLLLWGSPHFGNPRRPEIQKIQGALEMASGKGARIAKWTILLLLWGSAHFGSRKSRKSKGPWKWLPEKERTLRNGRFCCFCVVPLISATLGGRKSRKSMGPWTWLPEKERTLRNGRFCCFCGVPLISAAFGGRQPRKSKGPWKWLPEKERTLRNGRFCCFCGVPLISATLGSGIPENPWGHGNGFRKRSEHCEMDDFAAFVGFRSFRLLRRPEVQKTQGAMEMASGKGANIAKWTILLLLWGSAHFGTSTAGNPENPGGLGNGYRKRSEHCEMDDFAAFLVFRSFRQPSAAEIQKIQRAMEMASGKGARIAKWTILLLLWGSAHFGSFGGRKSRKSMGPWKWLPEKERTLRNGRFCCFCGVPLISATLGGGNPKIQGAMEMASGKGAHIAKWTILLLLWGSPHFGNPRRPEIQKIQGAMASGKGANIVKWTILLLLWGSAHFGPSAAGNPDNPRGPGNGFRKRSEHCEMNDFAAFVGFRSFRQRRPIQTIQGALEMASGKERILRNVRFCCFSGVPLIWAPRRFGLLWGLHGGRKRVDAIVSSNRQRASHVARLLH